MGKQKRILVTGAGGFIGHHLVKRLKSDGHWVRGRRHQVSRIRSYSER
jgi:nucleoside-diphosphate-sugar epimerase